MLRAIRHLLTALVRRASRASRSLADTTPVDGRAGEPFGPSSTATAYRSHALASPDSAREVQHFLTSAGVLQTRQGVSDPTRRAAPPASNDERVSPLPVSAYHSSQISLARRGRG